MTLVIDPALTGDPNLEAPAIDDLQVQATENSTCHILNRAGLAAVSLTQPVLWATRPYATNDEMNLLWPPRTLSLPFTLGNTIAPAQN